MFGLFDWLKVGAGVLLGAAVAYQVGHWRGDSHGRAAERAAARTRALHLIENGAGTMRKSRGWIWPACALSLMAAGCQTRTAATDGAGFSLMTPSPATKDFIIKNDRPFANQVAGNNRTCRAAPACSK